MNKAYRVTPFHVIAFVIALMSIVVASLIFKSVENPVSHVQLYLGIFGLSVVLLTHKYFLPFGKAVTIPYQSPSDLLTLRFLKLYFWIFLYVICVSWAMALVAGLIGFLLISVFDSIVYGV